MVVLRGRRLVLGARARGTAARGRRWPLRGAQRRVEQAERVPGQPGQGVTDAGELAAAGAARVPVPARRTADRAPLTLRGLVGRFLGGRGLPDIGLLGATATPSAADRGPHPARDFAAYAFGAGLHQPPLEIANRVAARLSAHTGRLTLPTRCVARRGRHSSTTYGALVARKWPTFTHSVRPIRTRRTSGLCTCPKRAYLGCVRRITSSSAVEPVSIRRACTS